NWLETRKAIKLDEISLPTFRLLGYNKDSWRITFEETGEFNGVLLGLVVARNIAFYVARMYVPASLVVFISWIHFWLDQDHHARVALGVTTVLTITTLITNSNEDLPKI